MLGETGNEHLVKIWRSAEREVWGMSQKEWRGCFIADTWKYIACVAFNEVCFSSADIIICMRKSSPLFCHLGFLHPTKLKFSNVIGQWDKKENQMTTTHGPNLNSCSSDLQYIQIMVEVQEIPRGEMR